MPMQPYTLEEKRHKVQWLIDQMNYLQNANLFKATYNEGLVKFYNDDAGCGTFHERAAHFRFRVRIYTKARSRLERIQKGLV